MSISSQKDTIEAIRFFRTIFRLFSRLSWTLAAVVFVILVPVVYAAAITFTERQVGGDTYDQVRAIEANDLDDDGDMDIVSVSDALDDLTWWANNGSQSFTQNTIDGSISGIYDVKVIDLDRDGDKDILAAASNTPKTVWYENNGTETFTQRVISSTGDKTCIDAADLDGDLDIDIITCDSGQIGWWQNNGSQSFTQFTVSTGNTTPVDIKAIDLDEDGDVDIVSTWQTGNRVLWYENNGTGTFTQRTIDSSITTPWLLDVGDVDDDLDLDVVVASITDDNFILYLNNGTETFTESTIGSLNDASGVWIGDIDGDGDKDVAAIGYASNTVMWWDNNGTESFTARIVNATFEQGRRIQIVDVNSDGRNDLVTAGVTNNFDNVTWWENIGPTPPSVSTLFPADGGYNVSTTANLVITFDQEVQGSTGAVVIKKTSDSSVIETLMMTGGLISGSGTTQIIINPSVTLATDTDYHITIGKNAFKGSKSPHYAGISNVTSWNFTTTDTIAPTVSTLSPADNATGINQTANLVITFSEIVQGGTGTIIIKKASDDSTIESIAANSGLVTGSGTTQITINPASTLTAYVDYYVTILQNVFKDRAGNKYAGISSTSTWNFTTADLTNPTVSSFSPTDNATGVSNTANLVITFSEPVMTGTGTVVIRRTSDNSTIETITSNNTTYVSGSGTTVITINPSTALALNISHYIIINKNAFEDMYSRDYAGFITTTTWNFTTSSTDTTKPKVFSLSPADNATGVSNTANLVITFDEAVQGGTGTVVIKKTSDNSTVETITTNNTGLVSGSGTTAITINPATILSDLTGYYVIINKNAFQDALSNDYQGFTSTTVWNFTTGDTVKPVLSTLSPADNATNVSRTANLVITFDEAVITGSGTIAIRKASDSSVIETIVATSALVTGSGTTEITVNPVTTLEYVTDYYVTVHANSFRDTSGNTYTGVVLATTWNFTTEAAPVAASSDSSSSSGGLNERHGGSRGATMRRRIGEILGGRVTQWPVPRTEERTLPASFYSAPPRSPVRERLRLRVDRLIEYYPNQEVMLLKVWSRLDERLARAGL